MYCVQLLLPLQVKAYIHPVTGPSDAQLEAISDGLEGRRRFMYTKLPHGGTLLRDWPIVPPVLAGAYFPADNFLNVSC